MNMARGELASTRAPTGDMRNDNDPLVRQSARDRQAFYLVAGARHG